MSAHFHEVLLLIIIASSIFTPCSSKIRFPLISSLTQMPCDLSLSSYSTYNVVTQMDSESPKITILQQFLIGGWFLLRGFSDLSYTIYSFSDSSQLYSLAYNPVQMTMLHKLTSIPLVNEQWNEMVLDEWLFIYTTIESNLSPSVGTTIYTRIHRNKSTSGSGNTPIYQKPINDLIPHAAFSVSLLMFNLGHVNAPNMNAPSCSYVKYASLFTVNIVPNYLFKFLLDIQGEDTNLLWHLDPFYTNVNRGKLFSLDATENAQILDSNVSDNLEFVPGQTLNLDHINASHSLGFAIQFSFLMYTPFPADTRIFTIKANEQTFKLKTKGGNKLELNSNQMSSYSFTTWTHIVLIIQQGVEGKLFLTANGFPNNRLYISFPIVRTISIQFGLNTNTEHFKFNSIRVIQGIYFEDSADCFINFNPPNSIENSCLVCQSTNLISMQNDQKCFSSTPLTRDVIPFEQKWSPARSSCQIGMIHERPSGLCRCRIQEYTDSTGKCKPCPRYCKTCISPTGFCSPPSDPNRIQATGKCQPTTFDDGFDCKTSIQQDQLFQPDKFTQFYQMPPTTKTGSSLNAINKIFDFNILNYQSGKTVLFAFSFDPSGMSVFFKHVIATATFNTTEVITVSVSSKAEGLSAAFFINGTIQWEQNILSNTNSWFSVWTNKLDKTVFQIHSNWYIVSKEIPVTISVEAINPSICIGSCPSKYPGYFPSVGVFNIRPFNFIADIGNPHNYSDQIAKLLLDETILYHIFTLETKVYQNTKFKKVASSYGLPESFIDFKSTTVDFNQILGGFGFIYSKTTAIYTLPSLIFPPSFSTSIFFKRILSQTTLLWYKFTNEITIEYFLIPFEQSRNVGIRICVKFDCQDTQTTKLNIGEPNFLSVFTIDQSPFQIDFLRLAFSVTCNYQSEVIVFFLSRPRTKDITLHEINFFNQSEWTRYYLIYLNRITIFNGNSYFYFAFSNLTNCFMRLGSNGICIQPKPGFLIFSVFIISESSCVSASNSSLVRFKNQYTRECLEISMPPNCMELDLVTTFSCKRCNDGYFQQTKSYDCIKCDLKCATCSLSSSICDKCHDAFLQVPPTCDCLQQNYFLNASFICEICSTQCQECSGSSSNCTTCSNNRIDPPTCACDPRTMTETPITPTIPPSLVTGTQCTPIFCDNKCATCEYSSSNCISCKPNRTPAPSCACVGANTYIDSIGNCETCTQGMYLHQSKLTCFQCKYPCMDCINYPTYCLSCEDNLILINNTCLCSNSYLRIKKSDGITSVCAKEIEIVSFIVSIHPTSKNYMFEFQFPIQLFEIDFKANPIAELLEFSFEEISATMFSLANPSINEDIFSVELIPSVEFKATTGYVIFKQNIPFISTTEDQILSRDYLINPFRIPEIGSLFLKSDSNPGLVNLNQVTDSINSINPFLLFLLQGMQIMFYIFDVLQPTALFLLASIQYPPYLYSLLQMIGITVFPTCLDYQETQLLNKHHSTKFQLGFPQDEIDINTNMEFVFKRIGLSNSLLISFPIVLLKYLLIYIFIFMLDILKNSWKQREQTWRSALEFLRKRAVVEVEINLLVSCIQINLNFDAVNGESWTSRYGFYGSIFILAINGFVVSNLAVQISKGNMNATKENITKEETNQKQETSINQKSSKNSRSRSEQIESENDKIFQEILTKEIKKKRIKQSRSYFFFQLILKFIVVQILYSFRDFPLLSCILSAGCFAISAALTLRMKPYLSLRTRHLKSFMDCVFVVCWILCSHIVSIEQELLGRTASSPNTFNANLFSSYIIFGDIVAYLLILVNALHTLEQICCLVEYIKEFMKERKLRKEMFIPINYQSEINNDHENLVYQKYSAEQNTIKNDKDNSKIPPLNFKSILQTTIFPNKRFQTVLKQRNKKGKELELLHENKKY